MDGLCKKPSREKIQKPTMQKHGKQMKKKANCYMLRCWRRIEHPSGKQRITFTEEEMNTFLKKGDLKLLLDEINWRQKASRPGKGRRSSVKNHEKNHHPSVKIIPATK
jgi:hypothetical protein